MNTERLAADGLAALVSFLLLMSPLVIKATETYSANLVGIETIENTGLHSQRISIRIGNRVEHLLVSRHTHLNDLHIVNSHGVPVDQTGVAYTGIVESLPSSSWARILIDGTFISGTINSGDVSTHFSSDAAIMKGRSYGSKAVMIKPLKVSGKESGKTSVNSGAKRAITNSSLPLDELSEEIVVPISPQSADTTGTVTRVARIGVVVDSLFQEAIGGRGLSKAIATINSVDGLYREKFGLALKIDIVVLATDDATINLQGPTIEDILTSFVDYRNHSELLPAELSLVHLFSGFDSEGDAVGLAYSGGACRTDGQDVSISRPFRYQVLLAAHEIGHNLGAEHDDATTDCSAVRDHLMFSEIDASTTREFSSCSVDTINTNLAQGTCYTTAIDIGLKITQLESNQILATVTNLDSIRAFPSATLHVDLDNATVAEAPALCELEEPTKLICTIPATFAGDSHDLAVKVRLEPGQDRTITTQLQPDGFFDLNEQNNRVTLAIPSGPVPLAVTGGGITTQGENASSGGASSGGGLFELPWLLLLIGVCAAGNCTSNLRKIAGVAHGA